MTTDYDKRFIFDVLYDQIRVTIDHWGQPITTHTYKVAADHYWDSITEDGVMHIRDAKLPDIRWFADWNIWPTIYADSLLVYHLFDNVYSEPLITMLECGGCEGPYGFENVKVEKGDVVIDAGGYIGDNAAQYAAVGARAYSFEPSQRLWQILDHTARLNDFEVVKKGLGDLTSKAYISNSPAFFCSDSVQPSGNEKCDIITIDEFADKEHIKVDFIKSDIEGFERYMLKGARKTLECDAPKLALKTYHLPDDPIVMKKLILEANPKYKILQRSRIMYCYV